jgi:Uma2 family endonuclease
MNQHFTFPPQRPTTQAAEGVPRWRWTIAEIERMVTAAIFNEYDKFELLGGEIVPMSPKGIRHELMREELSFRFSGLAFALPGIFVASEADFKLSDDTLTEPDILVRPSAIKTHHLRGSDVLLLVEVADSSLSYDLKTKAPLYAANGVREYWVINALTLMTTVHLRPDGNVYAASKEFLPTERLVPSLAPQLAVSLNELDLSD